MRNNNEVNTLHSRGDWGGGGERRDTKIAILAFQIKIELIHTGLLLVVKIERERERERELKNKEII